MCVCVCVTCMLVIVVSCVFSGSPAASPDSSDNSDTQHSGGSDMEMDDQMMTGSKRSQQRLSDTVCWLLSFPGCQSVTLSGLRFTGTPVQTAATTVTRSTAEAATWRWTTR